ncbi:MAG: hypothetical protein SGPRY_010939 [Prymnesium sp.]
MARGSRSPPACRCGASERQGISLTSLQAAVGTNAASHTRRRVQQHMKSSTRPTHSPRHLPSLREASSSPPLTREAASPVLSVRGDASPHASSTDERFQEHLKRSLTFASLRASRQAKLHVELGSALMLWSRWSRGAKVGSWLEWNSIACGRHHLRRVAFHQWGVWASLKRGRRMPRAWTFVRVRARTRVRMRLAEWRDEVLRLAARQAATAAVLRNRLRSYFVPCWRRKAGMWFVQARLLTLQAAAQGAARVRAIMEAGLSLHIVRCFRRYFRCWRCDTVAAAARLQLLNRFTPFRTRWQQVGGVRRWASEAGVLAALSLTATICREAQLRTQRRRACGIWLRAAASLKASAKAEKWHVLAASRHLSRLACTHWSRVVGSATNRRWAAMECAKLGRQKMVRRGLALWLLRAAAILSLADGVRTMQARVSRRLQKGRWEQWATQASISARLEDATRRARTLHLFHHQTTAWERWLLEAATTARDRISSTSVCTLLCRRALTLAMSRWSCEAHGLARRCQNGQRQQALYVHRRRRIAVALWRESASTIKEACRMRKLALWFATPRVVACVMSAWTRALAIGKRQTVLLQAACKSMTAWLLTEKRLALMRWKRFRGHDRTYRSFSALLSRVLPLTRALDVQRAELASCTPSDVCCPLSPLLDVHDTYLQTREVWIVWVGRTHDHGQGGTLRLRAIVHNQCSALARGLRVLLSNSRGKRTAGSKLIVASGPLLQPLAQGLQHHMSIEVADRKRTASIGPLRGSQKQAEQVQVRQGAVAPSSFDHLLDQIVVLQQRMADPAMPGFSTHEPLLL